MAAGAHGITDDQFHVWTVGCDRWGCDRIVDFCLAVGADPDILAALVARYRAEHGYG